MSEDEDDFEAIVCSEEHVDIANNSEMVHPEPQKTEENESLVLPNTETELDAIINKYYDDCLLETEDIFKQSRVSKKHLCKQPSNEPINGSCAPSNSKITKKRRLPFCSGKRIFYNRRKIHSEELEELLTANDSL